jgi:Domain of unknown function DUF11
MSIGGLGMRGNIAFIAVPVLAITGAVLSAGTPAHAEGPSPAADLRMVYEHPEIAKDNSGVTWHWVLTNNGAAGAETVVATHRVSAGQKVVGMSQPCAGQGNDVVCQFGSIKPGEKRTGWIKTTVAGAGGQLQVNAQVTWRETQSILPGVGDPAPVDAGAWGTDSWGVSGTHSATQLPTPDSR